ncbi:MAG TPA: HNH endonuclease [Chitinophagaceae bacterium]|nr:HNH endonuclease [Chitinophagaceae bacterium]
MSKSITKEIWKEVDFEIDYTNDIIIEVSNLGRIRSISAVYGETFLKGSLLKGYRIIRLKFMKERSEKDQKRLDFFREQIATLIRRIGKMRTRNKAKRVKDESYYEYEAKIAELTQLLGGLQKRYKTEFRAIELRRTINAGGPLHRMIAKCFVHKPSPKHDFVAHLDYDKLNNRADNLQWMTQDQLTEHHRNSPAVIEAKKNRFGKRIENSKVCKLTSTKVMLIKKKLQAGATLRSLAKSFKVSEMQLSRIRRGENWGDIKPAN